MKYHFISGLPRSGSTLLSALLRQNPRFTAGMSSPLVSLVLPLIPTMSSGAEHGSFFDDQRRRSIVRGIFDGYYARDNNREVIFDTNRTWAGKMPILCDVFPESKVICCVRELGWIIDSIERMLNKNPLEASKIFDRKAAAGNIYAREAALMDPTTGLVGNCYSNLRAAWCGEEKYKKKMMIVSYEGLTKDPIAALKKIYQELGEPYFSHDINNVEYDEPDYDANIGMPGLHKVKPRVEHQVRAPIIPPDIFAKYVESNFWNEPPLGSVENSASAPVIIC